jgi:hypothetical protein
LTNSKQRRQPSRAASPDVDPPRIGWALIVRDLLAAGCSKYRIAAALGVSISTVQVWARISASSDIRYGYGRALIRLHSRYCGAALTFQRITEAEADAYNSPA